MLRKLRERRQAIPGQSLHGTSEKEYINIDDIAYLLVIHIPIAKMSIYGYGKAGV